MKNFYLLALPALLLSGCSQESGLDGSNAGEIVKFTSSISGNDATVNTRATGDLTHFPELRNGGTECVVIFGDVVDGDNTIKEEGNKYTMNSDANGVFELRDNGKYEFPAEGGLNFYSIWPNDNQVFGSGQALYPSAEKEHALAMHSNRIYYQSGKNSELSTNDVMLAVKRDVKSNPVQLKYHHLTSNISVALKKGSGNWTDGELENAVVRIHVPRGKLKVDYPNLKTWINSVSDVDNITAEEFKQILSVGGYSNGNFMIDIDTYVTTEDGNAGGVLSDISEYGRAFVVPFMYTNNSNNYVENAYIEIFKSRTDAGAIGTSYGSNDPIPTSTMRHSLPKQDLYPNHRYIFTITVNKSGTSTRSGESSYSIGSTEMLIQDCGTGEIILND